MKVTRSDGPLVVAVDTSTTATKAVVVDPVGRVLATGRSDIPLHTPADGFYEHDPRDWWRSTDDAVRAALAERDAKLAALEDWRSAVAMAYGHLWHINNEPMAPIPLRSEESASYAARKLLRDLLTTEERGEAINSVRAMLTASPKEPT